MRILCVANPADIYGAGRSLLRLTSRLAKDGHAVEVILPCDGPLRPCLEEAGVRTLIHTDLPVLARRNLRTPRACLHWLWQVVTSTIRLTAHIRASRPDIVHTNTAVLVSSGLAAKLCGVPHVWHVREFCADVSRLWLVYQWLMYAFSSVLICISDAVANQFHSRIRNRRVVVIHCGIPAGEFTPPTAERVLDIRRKYALTGRPLVGVVGRINLEQKGQDVFVQAAAALASKFPEAGFVVVGSPFQGNQEHRRRLDRLVEELRLGDRISFTGDVEDVAAMYAALGVCVLPVRKPEGLGNVLIEAMAMGKPVVGSAIGGIPEIIEDGKNGFLVEPNDAGALADALERLLADPELCRRMGQEGRRRFDDCFEFSAFFSKMWSVYESVLARHAAAGSRLEAAANSGGSLVKTL
jgi:glycosyltransferase involved in cell wall biosynthesis